MELIFFLLWLKVALAFEIEPIVLSADISAYTSSIEETDNTPHTTASGQRTREGIIANNCLDFGTKVEIKGKTYEVQDRMNSRYDCNSYDIWFKSKKEALKFGRQILLVKILYE